MTCKTIRKFISLYLDNQLESKELEQVRQHTTGCADCQKELAAYEQSWQLLSEYKDIQPQPNFMGRFWTRVAAQKTWQEKFLEQWNFGVWQKSWAYVRVGLCLAVLVGSVVLWQNKNKASSELLANMGVENLEMLENFELAEKLDVITDMDFYEDLDVIENLENLEALEGQG